MKKEERKLSEMTEKELQNEAQNCRSEMRALLEKAELEGRDITKEEQEKYDELNKRTERAEAYSLTLIRSLPLSSGMNIRVGEDRSEKEEKAPLLRAFREAVEGNLSDETRDLFSAGNEEMRKSGVSGVAKGFNIPIESRTLQATVNTQVVATGKKTILEPLRNELVFGQLGANIMTGLVGDIEFPKYSGTTSYWKGETESATDGAGTFSLVKYAPKRLTTLLDVSMQFLIQDSVQAEEMLRRDLINSIREKLESTAFGASTGGDAPTGLFNGTLDFEGVDTHAELIKVIASVKKANALSGSLGFVTNAMGEAKLLATPLNETGTYGFLANNGKIANYKYAVTEGVADIGEDLTLEHGLIFANWMDFIVGQWGGINFVVDNISKAADGMVRFVINSFWDFGFRRDESVSKASITPLE